MRDHAARRPASGLGVSAAPQWAIDAEGSAAVADQGAADADQTSADADQTAAERDESDAASDQRSADQDQAAADRQRPASATRRTREANEASRQAREMSRIHRLGTHSARAQTARLRAETAARRDATAAARDATAERRDVRARTTDQSIARSEMPLAEKIEKLLARLAAVRARAAAERARAARDRAGAEIERAKLAAELHNAHLDDLTGAFRRELGRTALTHEIDRARRADGRFVIAFVDVDDLKSVNDRDGHAAGDHVLQTVVWTMRRHLRSFDPVVRYGGDEFVCGLGGADLEEVGRRYEAIDRSVRKDVGVGISVGLAALGASETLDQLIARADAALLETKRTRGE
jgi:diguanylate cyclase (GGDEF)-like protein